MTTGPFIGEFKCYGETAYVEFFYPRTPNHVKTIEIGLEDVRAADNIRVSYDFERDGWKIEQASRDMVDDEDWQEVAFVHAWGRWEAELE